MAKLRVDWSRKNTTDVDPTIGRFERWLNEHGYREACVETYVGAVRKFLVVAKSANSTLDDAMMWHGDLDESKSLQPEDKATLRRLLKGADQGRLKRMKRDYMPPKPAFRRSYGYDAFVEDRFGHTISKNGLNDLMTSNLISAWF